LKSFSDKDAFRRLNALLAVGLRLAGSARSGQVLLARVAASLDPQWIPRPWGDELLRALEAASEATREQIEPRRVERMLAEAWGARATDELDELDPSPVAVTPSAQVHRGQLDGKPVAVKVLRPGIAASVRQDLTLLEGLLAPLAAAFPAADPRALVGEFRERVLDELDLEHEATIQRRFHRALRRHPYLTVPAPVMRLCHEQVLVSEWIDGTTLWRAPDPDTAAARLVVFVLGAARSGVVHADPHPDDVLVLDDGRLAILDFGASRSVDPARLEHAAAVLDAFAADDPVALGGALERLGLLAAVHGPATLELAKHTLGELGGADPARLDSAALVAARDRLFERPELLVEVILAGSLAPEDLWPARAAAQLFASIARVGATGRWRALVRAALTEGWDASG